mmetsp:Transcript_2166/g.4975  ORF Transcript_2166/g.4975 Transcript_2166/m.4975 type:complete len:589 (-) Transcript_2166:29-1795(-)
MARRHQLAHQYRLLLLLLLLLDSATVEGTSIERRRRFVDYLSQRSRQEQEPQTDRGDVRDATADVEERFVEQRLDHFSSVPEVDIPTRTFRQRYFYTSRYVHSSSSSVASAASAAADTSTPSLRRPAVAASSTRPVYAFLCMGGEGPCLTKDVLVSSVHCTGDMIELARRLYDSTAHNADVHLYVLEHRYYGDSYPKFYNDNGTEESPVSNDNLVYLSSRQALADAAHFVSTVVVPRAHNQAKVRVITFGGSYPGMLAAWARLKYPHLVHGAVSNSAPVQAQLDFPEYNDRVSYDLANDEVGDCLRILEEGHAEIAQLLTSSRDVDSREQVATLFNVCGGEATLVDNKNVSAFLGDGVVFVPAQSNDPSCDDRMCNIDHLCSSLIAAREVTGSNVKALAAVSKQQRGNSTACIEVDWEGTIRYLSSDEAKEEGLRSWLWQTCTEFGFYQTCEAASSCPYGKGYHTIDLDLEICRRAFGITEGNVWSNVQQSIEQYGGWNIDASRILFVNGDIDPWAMLGVDFDHGSSSALSTIWVEGASHHFWTHEIKDSDGEGIKKAREAIYRHVVEWLDEGADAEGDSANAFVKLS